MNRTHGYTEINAVMHIIRHCDYFRLHLSNDSPREDGIFGVLSMPVNRQYGYTSIR